MYKITRLLSVIFIHSAVYLCLTLLWILSFHSSLLKHMDVFFYRGLGLILLFGSVSAVVLFLLKKIIMLLIVSFLA